MVWNHPVVRIPDWAAHGAGRVHGSHRFLQRRAAAGPVTLRKPARITWFVATLLVCLLRLGRAGQYPLRWSDAFNLRNDILATSR